MNTDRPVAVPQDSATVLLLREAASGIETLMLQRHTTMNFAGGDWVFPGGASEIADRSPRMLQCIANPLAAMLGKLRHSCSGAPLEKTVAVGLCVAACRETFEESGVLLARHSSGAACSPDLVTRLQGERAALQTDPEWFVAMLERHDLVLELDRLVYLSNWITPSLSPRRFDARFFIAAMPAGQQVDPHLGESNAARWVLLDSTDAPPALTPPVTSPPTEFALLEVAREYRQLGSLSTVLEAARHFYIGPLMIKMCKLGDVMTGLLPWDADYDAAPGEGVSCDDRLRERFGHFTSRRAIDPGFRMPRPKSG